MASVRQTRARAFSAALALGSMAVGCGISTSDDVGAATPDASSGAAGAAGAGGGALDASSDGGPVPIHHRASDAQCSAAAPAGNCTCGGNCSSPPFLCNNDAQCADAGPNGRCISPGGPAGCGCTYDACAGDADCPTGQTCACHGSPYTDESGSRCVPGNCRVDADCGDGGFCSPSASSTCGDAGYLCLGYYCHTKLDECTNDGDCTGATNTCVYSSADARWTCAFYSPPL
jgi:hypothetical protein